MIPSGAVPASYQGVISAFDAAVGLGQIRAADGAMLGFHCVGLADGSRQIEVGAAVRFSVAAGLHGRWEAATITPIH